MSRNYKQGIFTPKFPEKYLGNPTNIVFRSSWEKRFMTYCDLNQSILSWVSEEVVVPYFFDLDGKNHRYFVDFLITIKTESGSKTLLIEIKPKNQMIKPNIKGRMTKSKKDQIETWCKNQCKWKAADAFAKKRGWEFKVMNEEDLGIKW